MRISAKIILGILLACSISISAHAQQGKREITNVKGDVYRFQNSFHYSVFVVTEKGIVFADPINLDAASWVKAEMTKRFAKTVTHLIYSHSHADHASGGSVFADNAIVISQKNAPASIDGVTPNIRFSKEMSFNSGKHVFELTALGAGHGTDLLAMVIRPENVAFIVDSVSPGTVQFRDFPHVDVAGLINQLKTLEALDYEVIAPGHSRIGSKKDVTDQRKYVEWLREAVAKELNSGKSVDDIVATLDTSAYSSWGGYKRWRDLNIQGMVRWLKESGEVK